MGTQTEYSINSLGTSSNSSNFTVNGFDNLDYFHNSGLKVKYKRIRLGDKFQTSVNRMLENKNVDFIRMTMQLHEDIFKHQVQELHRLYRVQKMLMDELKKETKQSRFRNIPMKNSEWQNPTTQITSYVTNLDFRSRKVRDDDLSSIRELSSSCSGDKMRILRGFDLEKPADEEEDISTGISVVDHEDQAGPSSQMRLKGRKMSEVGSDDDDSDQVELTLSIGSSSFSKKKAKSENNKETYYK